MYSFMDMDFNGEGDSAEFPAGLYIPDANECRSCGQCVSTCPTFKLFEVDAETPRQRIRTISKLIVEDIAISADERNHLDNCLQCRACETVCPSKMAYGQLFDQAQAKLAAQPTRLGRFALGLIEHKTWLKLLLPLLAGYLKSGIQKPLRQTGLLKKLGLAEAEALLTPPSLSPLAGYHPCKTEKRGQVALFTGCITEHFDRETLTAAIKLLNAIGYDVLVPPEQNCCGAIFQHNGLSAAGLIDNNLNVFNALDVEAVLYTASGCGAMLTEYPVADQGQPQFADSLQDITEFLLQHWPDSMHLQPSNLKVAVHEPCSQRNVLKNQQATYALLGKIPGLIVEPLPENKLCCGAGGSYLLTHPENAQQLRAQKQQLINAVNVDQVVSSNFGCAVFLTQNANKILHPLVLLAGQLGVR